jgi:thiamine-monophosphate kinase
MQRTELNTLGEFGLIDRIKQNFSLQNKESLVGIGDDCAVIDTGAGELTLITTDMLLEGIHFDLTYCPLAHVGYKAVAANVSDIAAMNGTPKQIVVSIALSNRFSVEAIDELYKGIQYACEDFKVDLVGGDTTSSRSGLVISITAVGSVDKSKIAYRNTAKPGDVICVTGDLGGAYMGLQVLEREKQVFLANPEMQPELEGKDYIIERQLKPIARTDIVYELSEQNIIPHSMIDISDGLASELLHICKASGTGAVLFEDKLPIDSATYDTALELNISPLTCMMNGGEDYELLFTLSQQDYDKIRLNPNITAIGIIKPEEQGIKLQSKAGTIIPIMAQGWTHF